MNVPEVFCKEAVSHANIWAISKSMPGIYNDLNTFYIDRKEMLWTHGIFRLLYYVHKCSSIVQHCDY